MFQLQIDNELELKLLDASHADDLFALIDRNRPYLREWLPWVDAAVSIENTLEFIQFTERQYAENNGFQCGIFLKGCFVGCIGLHGIDWRNKKTSIGYWLGSEYQGRAIITRACSTLLHYLLSELQLNRVEIRAGTLNAKSRAIPERLGFIVEGTAREAEWLYDHYIDHVIYGMLSKDWTAPS
jgi:ribosomal-protein-serine acetyltransferase